MSQRELIERPDYVRVVNGNKFTLRGSYDGEEFEFLPGKPLDIPVVVAQHIFDFGRPDKTRALNRLGWMQASDQHKEAMAKLEKVRFTEAPPLIEADMLEVTDTSKAELLPHGTGTSNAPGGNSGEGGRGRTLPGPQNL